MSGERVQAFHSAFAVESWLSQNAVLSAENRHSLAETVSRLVSRTDTDRKLTIGIAGAPGSGKSTLSRTFVHCLNEMGTTACLLSLDDYYLDRPGRERMARDVHPLFRQRGVPGTHDIDRLKRDHDRIRAGEIEGLQLPVFDKSEDNRMPPSHWKSLESAPQIIVIEGWCIGATPQKPSELDDPVNDMERLRDADGSWRRTASKAWQRMHSDLDRRLDQVWYIRVPDWDCVVDWRWQQEQELARKNLQSRLEVMHFLACFERIVSHMQQSCPEWADLVLETDREHNIRLPDHQGN